MTVLVLLRMMFMEISYIAPKYFDEDTRFDAVRSTEAAITVASTQITTLVAGQSEVRKWVFMWAVGRWIVERLAGGVIVFCAIDKFSVQSSR